MDVVILAGGKGTRLSLSKNRIPKPLITIGNIPILTHIINFYASYGHYNFIICLGYKGSEIKKHYNTKKNLKKLNSNVSIKFVNTGLNSLTGDRIKRIKNLVSENFFMTYGDGISDVNINKTLKSFNNSKKIGLVTAINPQSRFGVLDIKKNNLVQNIYEKNFFNDIWINAGFFILNKKIFNYLKGNKIIFEEKPLKNLSKSNQLACFKHRGFWACIDTFKDKLKLEEIYKKNKFKWKKN